MSRDIGISRFLCINSSKHIDSVNNAIQCYTVRNCMWIMNVKHDNQYNYTDKLSLSKEQTTNMLESVFFLLLWYIDWLTDWTNVLFAFSLSLSLFLSLFSLHLSCFLVLYLYLFYRSISYRISYSKVLFWHYH